MVAVGLTDRETEALFSIAQSRSNCENDEAIRVAPLTVKQHVEHVFLKLGVTGRAQATLRAVRLITQNMEPQKNTAEYI